MKNGPVFSNISMINRCFNELGSPLHYSLIIDYLRINWANGRGIHEEDAINYLNLALKAGHYYEEVERQHYQRRSMHFDKLHDLFDTLQTTCIPTQYLGRKSPYNLQEINMDPRFGVVTTDQNQTFILLSEWNLLNDLVVRFLNKQPLVKATILTITQLIKEEYQIEDSNAFFFPHIDNRFKVNKKGLVSLSELGYVNKEDKIPSQITHFIREEVALCTPRILKLLASRLGEEVRIRDIIKSVFAIEVHQPSFSAYFEVVREHLKSYNHVFLVPTEDKLIYLPEEASPDSIEKFSYHGKTDVKFIEDLIRGNLSRQKTKEISLFKIGNSSNKESNYDKDTLSYTLRYYDRIQETLESHYFSQWIQDRRLEVVLVNKDDRISLIFFHDEAKNILYGPHLEEFMSDYALQPGQKLNFNMENNVLLLTIGEVDLKAASSQERYIDISRLAEENIGSKKTIVQLISEALIYHPSGLHVSEIIKYVLKDFPYAESSVSSTLSTYPFFQKDSNRNGFWYFNPLKWKKKLSLQDNTDNKAPTNTYNDSHNNSGTNKSSEADKIPFLELEETYRKLAIYSKNNRRRIKNEYFYLWDKKDFLLTALEYYAYAIYILAKKYSTDCISTMDLIQESYFALDKAYDNYNPEKSASFYHYSLNYVHQRFQRYVNSTDNIIRIPDHRVAELKKISKKYELALLKGQKYEIENDEKDLLLWTVNYISLDQLYGYYNLQGEFSEIDEIHRIVCYRPFLNPLEFNQCFRYEHIDLLRMEEPEFIPSTNYLYEDTYNISNDLVDELFNYISESEKGFSSISGLDVLKLRCGFNEANRRYTLEEIGNLYGVTRERIRQIEQKVLKKARVYLKKQKYF
ncbi:RNA polymerase, sigma 70 family subunit [Clostridium aceticum]|uniref:RNA polymerase, sigma 70 family subunit n=1 Tax=Clostridium aceticum TaxID=84022 RepID=A0A0D8IEP6_9CLOT|nr:sigma factor-like helix-turn-helix DNA-binding protein [Clostridium aceticum]AKL94717.1 RNA polymerase, sigma 70 family subunit [Clostridium aceticum]KJF27676.1 hypothetical protein TZ02_03395 [Clostridium aceticum]